MERTSGHFADRRIGRWGSTGAAIRVATAMTGTASLVAGGRGR